ncbi:MAG: hypothetical protein IKR49_01545 [Clostridia bacterium]|jgi:hypothetical protein|nr:hypothetical protein [Clostridia bacterium]
MKKVIAILLVVISLVSLMSIGLSVFAGNDQDETKIYAVIYAKGGIPVMYEPTPTFRYDGPGWLTVSADTPIAIDYDFLYWIDQDNNRYYPGDKIYVDHEVKLTPVFAPKTDSDIHTTRVIKAAFQALIRVLEKAFGFFKDFEEFNAD